MDVVDQTTRSRMMASIRGKDTKPELVVRRALHARGFRFRLHQRTLPGHPDIVLPRFHAVVFVHGCFWHGHDCPYFRLPKTRPAFWQAKIERNRSNDSEHMATLAAMGWRAAVVWECALRADCPKAIELLAEWIRSDGELYDIRG